MSKDSGVAWIGEIPADWEVWKVSHSFKQIGSGTTPLVSNSDYYDNGTIPWVNTGDLNNGFVKEAEKRITQHAIQEHSTLRLYPPNTLLVAMYGATIGKIGILEMEACTNQACCALAYPKHFEIKYLYYWFLDNKSNIVSLAYGGTQPNISQDLIRSLKIQAPSISDQCRIAAYLDEQTAKIDNLIALRYQQIDLLKEQRAALIQQAVTRGLNPNAPMKDSGFLWLGEIPSHLKTMQLRRLIRSGTSITYGIVQAGPHIEGGIPYIRTSDMSGESLPLDGYLCTSSEIDNSYKRSKVNTGDVVVAIRATIGKVLPVPPELEGANLTQGTAKISPNKEVSTEFLLAALRSESSRQQFGSLAKGTTFLEITLDMLRRFTIALPPKEEQGEIVEFIRDETNKLDTLSNLYSNQIEQLQEYRAALIHECVTGQREVRK
jgi:restriction endonuclease S subunit